MREHHFVKYQLRWSARSRLCPNLSRESPAARSDASRRAELAAVRGLPLVAGSVQIPDLRIEYETATGDVARVDLELVTLHYCGAELAAKAQAGFRMYAAVADVNRVHAVLEERGLIVEILSL